LATHNGKVIGVDLTPEMIAKARTNAENLGLMNTVAPSAIASP